MYASLDELKTWIGDLPDGMDDHHLEPILLAADRWIDHKTGRHFSLENEATKLYYPTREGKLDVVDLVSITSIKLDTRGDRTYSTTLSASQYELLPYTDEFGKPAARFQELWLWPTTSQAMVPSQLVQIVGDFGYVVNGLPPEEIRLASLMLASRWWKRHEMPTGSVIVPDMGGFERVGRDDPDVNLLLTPYKRTRQWVIA